MGYIEVKMLEDSWSALYMVITNVNGITQQSETVRIFIVSLSTCQPCIKTKKLLDSYYIIYEYVNIDQASQGEKEYVMDNLDNFLVSGGMSKIYPMIIIDKSKLILGYDEKALNTIARNMIIEKNGNNI